MFKVIIDENYANLTVENMLEKLGISLPRRKQLLLNNLCYINKQSSERTDTLLLNDLFELDLSIFDVKKYRSIEFNLTVLYEDEYFIVVEKPSKHIIYDIDDEKDSVINYLTYYFKSYKKKCNVIPVHRLDTDTTGCLLFAKDVITAACFSKMFENNEITKKYVACVNGIIEQEGIIDKNIGKDRHINGKMVACKNGKPAITKFKLLKTNNKISLVEATLITGRTHQIRVHFSSIGTPLVGDTLYGSKIKNDRVMLHCQSLTFVHPIKKKVVTVYSPLPEDMKSLSQLL